MSKNSGRFGHVFEVDLQKEKNAHRLLIAASVDVLSRGSSNFGHDSSSVGFDVDWANFLDFVGKKHLQQSGNTIPTLIPHTLKNLRAQYQK